ncbi:hypothetical protein GQ53DRAFT_816028 [Thozetella sp. PMI_491]|nr:hypothetical protein GQ53DRAFT_816028 [Thozetella sp. PMI_491]
MFPPRRISDVALVLAVILSLGPLPSLGMRGWDTHIASLLDLRDTPPDLQISKDGMCGSGVTCQGSPFGDCCSENFWCGKTDAHCNQGCKPSFGICAGSAPAPPSPPTSAVAEPDGPGGGQTVVETIITTLRYSTTSTSVVRLTLWTTATRTITATEFATVETSTTTVEATFFTTMTATVTTLQTNIVVATTTSTAFALATWTTTAATTVTSTAVSVATNVVTSAITTTAVTQATATVTSTTTVTSTQIAVATSAATTTTTITAYALSTLTFTSTSTSVVISTSVATSIANAGTDVAGNTLVTRTVLTTATQTVPTTSTSFLVLTAWFTTTAVQTSTFVTTLIAVSSLLEISTKTVTYSTSITTTVLAAPVETCSTRTAYTTLPTYTTSTSIQYTTSTVYAIITTTITKRVTSMAVQTRCPTSTDDLLDAEGTMTVTEYACRSTDKRPPTATGTPAAPSPTLPGTAANCRKWHLTGNDETCESIAAEFKIEKNNLMDWNPLGDHGNANAAMCGESGDVWGQLQKGKCRISCDGVWSGYHLCVGV